MSVRRFKAAPPEVFLSDIAIIDVVPASDYDALTARCAELEVALQAANGRDDRMAAGFAEQFSRQGSKLDALTAELQAAKRASERVRWGSKCYEHIKAAGLVKFDSGTPIPPDMLDCVMEDLLHDAELAKANPPADGEQHG